MSYAVRTEATWRIWWRLLRPHTLTAAFIPVFIGTALALPSGDVNGWVFLAMMLASILIQSATNMFNEYYDFIRGLDTDQSVGIGGTIVRDGISPRVVLRLALIFFVVAILLGIYICIMSSWWIAVIGAVSMVVAYLYTGGPYPIASSPFGELISGFFMGFVIIAIAFYIQTGYLTTETVLLSIPISILVGAILTANNIRDLEGDKEHGRRTLAILLGKRNAVIFLASMFAISYVWVIAMIIGGVTSPWMLLVLFSLPKAIQAPKAFIGKSEPHEMMPAMKMTSQLHTQFGFLVTIGLLVQYVFSLVQ